MKRQFVKEREAVACTANDGLDRNKFISDNCMNIQYMDFLRIASPLLAAGYRYRFMGQRIRSIAAISRQHHFRDRSEQDSQGLPLGSISPPSNLPFR